MASCPRSKELQSSLVVTQRKVEAGMIIMFIPVVSKSVICPLS